MNKLIQMILNAIGQLIFPTANGWLMQLVTIGCAIAKKKILLKCTRGKLSTAAKQDHVILGTDSKNGLDWNRLFCVVYWVFECEIALLLLLVLRRKLVRRYYVPSVVYGAAVAAPSSSPSSPSSSIQLLENSAGVPSPQSCKTRKYCEPRIQTQSNTHPHASNKHKYVGIRANKYDHRL